MQRITDRDLDGLVKRINSITKSPLEPYTKGKDGKFTAQIGNYHLDRAYGGVSLHRMQTAGGGVEDVLGCGHVSKRELYHMMHSFIRGLELAS